MKSEGFMAKLSEFRKVALDVMCFVYFFEANPKPKEILSIAETLQKAGFQACLVGDDLTDLFF